MGLKFFLSIAILAALPSAARADEASGMAKDAGILRGQVRMEGPCAKGEHMIWVSRGKNLYYQAEVVNGATFEFHLLPGTYDVVVNNSRGCLTEASAHIEAGQQTPVAIALKPATKGRNPAMVATPYSCPWCATTSWNTAYMPSFAQYNYPWWYNYSNMAYANYAYPAMWNGGGYAQNYYPGMTGAHSFAAGKPNIYVSGPEGTQATVALKLRENANWLASVPAYNTKGWHVTLKKENRLKDSTAVHSYLFADYRMDEEGLQGEAGFCSARSGLINSMAAILAQAGFRRGEIRDFKAYWEYKMPPATRYCVYPQGNAELARSTTLETTPAAAKVTRLIFAVRPDPQLYPRDGVFSEEPSKTWVSPAAAVETRGRGPAGTSSVEVREWGVGFLGGQR